MKINIIYNRINKTNLPNKYFFTKFIKHIININNFYVINVKIVSENEIKKLNNNFRKINKSTNSLVFLRNININNIFINIGDIAICKSLIEKESKRYNIKLIFHWAHIIIHSCLHLLGINHKDEYETMIMKKIEENILKKFSIPNPH